MTFGGRTFGGQLCKNKNVVNISQVIDSIVYILLVDILPKGVRMVMKSIDRALF